VLADPGLSLASAVTSGAAAMALLDSSIPEVMLVDLGLPDMNGVELIRRAAARSPEIDILVVTIFGDDTHVMSSIEAGATGYLLKDSSAERICASIHELRAGGAPISPGIARRLLARFRQAPRAGVAIAEAPARAAAEQSPLSTREMDILRLVAKGMSFVEVGSALAISAHTVVTHVKKIYRKLAVHSRGEAVYEAKQLGLL
jgi:DNA-binding NarL/FixJ family response regulator